MQIGPTFRKTQKLRIMKKNLLTAAFLSVSVPFFAQNVLCNVGDGGIFHIGENALVYSGGGIQTRGTGKYDISGNMMVVGSASDAIRTLAATGNDARTDGGNIILRLNNTTDYNNSTYGQLYIQGLVQTNLTGIIDKEYKATRNGSMQQMALPFYNKSFSSLANNLGISGFSNGRNNAAIGYWEDERAVMHNILGSLGTLDNAEKDPRAIVNNNAARYYAVGTTNWNPESPNAAAQAISGRSVYAIKGNPFSDVQQISYNLTGAGYSGSTPISYGVGSGDRNNGIYNEKYKTYLQDSFDIPSQGYFNGTVGSESGTFGRNIYQFGNPFFTNIDLSTIGYNERTAGGDDGNTITSIQAVRYESNGVITNNSGTHATSYKYIAYAPDGTPVGDTKGSIIKPMQAFVLKLRNNATLQNIRFNTLRRFSYNPRLLETNGQSSNPNSVITNRLGATGSIKQLRIIGLDKTGNEVMRTYFVVGPDSKTGHHTEAKTQIAAYSGALSTREELPAGGEDVNASKYYWLYINEANEQDFFGKQVKMVADVAAIDSYKFELAENAVELNEGESSFADGGHSFYIEQIPGKKVKLKQGQIMAALTAEAGLYYGDNAVLGTETNSSKGQLYIAYDKQNEKHNVIFPTNWKSADIKVYDISGKLVFSQKSVSTIQNYILPIDYKGVYVVDIVSESGEKVVKKIIK